MARRPHWSIFIVALSWVFAATASAADTMPETESLLVARDIPWWIDPSTATADDHAAMQACEAEHAAYSQALVDLGFEVQAFDNDHAFAASMFVEDPAVALGWSQGQYHVVINRVGSPWRTDEGDALTAYFDSQRNPDSSRRYRIYDMRQVPGAVLDGGDVLRVEDHLFIGRSHHTNRAGADFLAQVARSVGLTPHTLPVPRGLHLKSGVTVGGPELIVYDPQLASARLLNAFGQMLPGYELAPVEHLGSNVLFLGEAPRTGRPTVLVAGTAPTTAQTLRTTYGLDVVELTRPCHEDLGGRLTCSSLRFPPAGSGAWSP